MTRETKFPSNDWRAKYFGPANLAQTLARVDELKKIQPAGMSLPGMSLRFILSNPDVGTTIIGMRKLAHVSENFALSDAEPLDKALLQELKAHRWDRVPQRWSD
jgi:aryl-alcohol dehydrogenase-like predicted oxidoreductase